MMFQHRVSSADNILTQAMRMTELDRLLPMSYGMNCTLPGGKERRAESANTAALPVPTGYDASSMFQLTAADLNSQPSPFVILPRADFEFLKQEILGLKHTMLEFQNIMTTEMQKLRMESQSLKRQVESQRCQCRDHGCRKDSNGLNEKAANQWQSNWQGTYGRTIDASSIGCSTPSLSQTPGLNGQTTGLSQTPGLSQSSDHHDSSGVAGFGCSTPEHNDNNSLSTFSCRNNSDAGTSAIENKPLTQLLPNYDIFVNKLTLQIVVNEAQSHKDTSGALYVLRRVIPLVFSWEELACSRGQGLNCKSTINVGNKYPLDPTRVMACKAYMRKFCVEFGCLEPTEKMINQTFNHQVNYSRRRVRGVLPRSRPRPSTAGSGQRNRRQPGAGVKQCSINNLPAETVANLSNNYMQM